MALVGGAALSSLRRDGGDLTIMGERIKDYDRGFNEAIDRVVLLLTMGADFYPKAPSERTTALLMDPATARRILDCVKLLGDRIRKRQEADRVADARKENSHAEAAAGTDGAAGADVPAAG
jgi:hypothetical protein